MAAGCHTSFLPLLTPWSSSLCCISIQSSELNLYHNPTLIASLYTAKSPFKPNQIFSVGLHSYSNWSRPESIIVNYTAALLVDRLTYILRWAPFLTQYLQRTMIVMTKTSPPITPAIRTTTAKNGGTADSDWTLDTIAGRPTSGTGPTWKSYRRWNQMQFVYHHCTLSDKLPFSSNALNHWYFEW